MPLGVTFMLVIVGGVRSIVMANAEDAADSFPAGSVALAVIWRVPSPSVLAVSIQVPSSAEALPSGLMPK